ncbi:carboxypeptidase-like regulatory domain-containing protein [Pontibacter sp. KCTC 32443]|uniref:DUF5686 and carboxypeptidase-like regulatory domain-containing protein n=1 Tax=Pontibacter TaxID=323449 RepID=UPI00164E8CB6|nr:MULTISPECIES: DUF5686 and carboxypeptidase-like regulatory domain-containing protein [Pontibacter]MBC5773548.1 carboxypeptidase-like regulatory domain-containing protein [Pontibacter sp. KCTC 32443]
MFLLGFHLQAQQVITGKVTDAATGEALPFVSVFIKKAGTGAPTNDEGKYSIKINQPADSITVSFIGYKTKSKAITRGVARQVIDFELELNSIGLQEIVVRPGENPAFRVMRQVMAHKEQNDKRQLQAYQYEAYSIMQLSVENMPGKKKAASLPILSDSSATSRKGKKVYPFFMSETLSDFYYNRDPERTKEIVKATKVAGVGLQDSDIFAELLGVSYKNHNFYQNWVTILSKSFISPIADGWKVYYNYDLEDSLYIGNTWCYKIKVAPKRPQDLAFKGYIWISEGDFALRKIDVAVSKSANINYVEGINLTQELEKTKAGAWLPSRTEMTMHVAKLNKALPNILARINVSNKNISVTEPHDAAFFDKPTAYVSKAKAPEFWVQNRHDSLSTSDLQVYAQIDSLNNTPEIKRYTELMTILVGGYKKAGKVSIGPIPYAYAYNNIEGHRIQLGAKTNINFSDKWEFSGFAAYGTRDEKVKYNTQVRYILNREKWSELGISYEEDLQQVGLTADKTDATKLFMASARFGKLDKPVFIKEASAYFQSDLFRGVTQRITFSNRTYLPQYDFAYYTGEAGEVAKSFTTSSVSYALQIARKEVFVENGNDRISLSKGKWPVISLRYTLGLDDVMGSTLNYQRLDGGIRQRLRTGSLGTAIYEVKAGKVFSPVPYPLLEVHLGNETPFYSKSAYSLMQSFEFASDTYAALSYEQHFEGLFLNSLPLVRKLKWRLFAAGDILYGTISQQNLDLIPATNTDGTPYQTFKSLSKEPYVELGYGVDNIFKFLRIHFIHRVTHLDTADVKNFGVKASVHFKL